MGVGEVAKALEVSEQSYNRWRVQLGAMQPDDVKRLKELERENAQLKRLVADKGLENLALRKISKGRMKVEFRSAPPCCCAGVVGAASRAHLPCDCDDRDRVAATGANPFEERARRGPGLWMAVCAASTRTWPVTR